MVRCSPERRGRRVGLLGGRGGRPGWREVWPDEWGDSCELVRLLRGEGRSDDDAEPPKDGRRELAGDCCRDAACASVCRDSSVRLPGADEMLPVDMAGLSDRAPLCACPRCNAGGRVEL